MDEIHFCSNHLASVPETQAVESNKFAHSHSSKGFDDSPVLALDVVMALMAPKMGRFCDAFTYPGQTGHVDNAAEPAPHGQRSVFVSTKSATHIDEDINHVLLCITYHVLLAVAPSHT